jgi:hypothetical protein
MQMAGARRQRLSRAHEEIRGVGAPSTQRPCAASNMLRHEGSRRGPRRLAVQLRPAYRGPRSRVQLDAMYPDG